MNGCTKCGGIIHEGECSWDFDDEILCQECWETHCSKLWWETSGGLHEPPSGSIIGGG